MAYLEQAPATRHAPARGAGGLSWPRDALQSFVLRMAGHGHSVSATLMNFDRAYALEQLGHAHAMADGTLRELAMVLFRHFERQRSGSAPGG